MDIFTTDYAFANGFSDRKLKLYEASYSYPEFRDDLEAAFIAAFGRQYVKRGSKGFVIKERNIHQVNSDVAAAAEHRRYRPDGSYHSGMTLRPENLDSFETWPEQHFRNAELKNNRTERRYKRFVRVMKKLCDYMARHGYPQAGVIPPYLNECLVYNTPDNLLSAGALSRGLREMLAYLRHALGTDEKCRKWLEVTEMNYLFHASRPWTREQAHGWILAAWEWLEYE
ncbi:MAG: nucleotidyltransferase [Betaproteobacteria bacterium]|nr:nucleotidyltransferase [Betaproteobacteria bacterium]